MANRLQYVLPIVRHLARGAVRRLLPGGLAGSLTHKSDAKQLIIVTGTGRSGTSAVARVLHESGVLMGDEFDEPAAENPVGFYQDIHVGTLNARIMMECGMRGGEKWPWRSTVLAVAERYRDEMRSLIAGARDGWKDPLFGLTLEAWLPQFERPPKVILCLRGPEAYVRSVARIYGLIDLAPVERWWDRELRRIVDVIEDYKLEATCVEYDRLVQHPAETLAELSAFVGRELDPQFVEPGLRHYTYAVPRRHAALYERALALGPDRESAVAQRRRRSTLLPRFGTRRLSDDEARAIEGYLERVRAVQSQMVEARAVWLQRAGLDADGGSPDQAAASEYAGELGKVQAELGALLPPIDFERYHDLMREAVDRERLIVEMMAGADFGTGSGAQASEHALAVWRRHESPGAVEEERARRSRAYQRALKASGYAGSGSEP